MTFLYKAFTTGFFYLLTVCNTTAQDLDPRAYARVPVDFTTVVAGFSYSTGDIVTDATFPVDNVSARLQSASLGVAHSFSLFKCTSQVLVALPYVWAKATGEMGNQAQEVTRSGFADTRLRFSILVHGAPPSTVSELLKSPRKTVVGVSLNMIVPTGQFFSDKLINLGTNRFGFRAEIGLSQPLGKRWLLDFYTGVWFFTNNNSFYPGNSRRTQEPMGTFQGHISYNINPLMWIAFDATFYVGGTSSINDLYKDDRAENSRIGVTAVVPVNRRHFIRLGFSMGAIVRTGQDFTSFSIGWQTSWGKKPKKDELQEHH